MPDTSQRTAPAAEFNGVTLLVSADATTPPNGDPVTDAVVAGSIDEALSRFSGQTFGLVVLDDAGRGIGRAHRAWPGARIVALYRNGADRRDDPRALIASVSARPASGGPLAGQPLAGQPLV